MTALVATVLYGLLSGLGGIWGYLKSNSKPSLISGCLSGFLLLVAAGVQFQGYVWGLTVAKIIVLALCLVFMIRLGKTKKIMPSGIMLIAGVAALSCLFV